MFNQTAHLSDVLGRVTLATLPPPKLTVLAYATKHRRFDNAGGGFVGVYDPAYVPYINEPQEVLTSDKYMTMAIVGPGQCAKTTIAENWLLYSVGSDPGGFLWYMQTNDAMEGYCKERIDDLIRTHPEMRERIGSKTVDNSLKFKRFTAMSCHFMPANPSSFINKRAPRIVLDEIDAYSPSLGDPVKLANIRRQTFGRRSMLMVMSHPDAARGMDPDRDWETGVMSVFKSGDRRLWWWQCPSCGMFSSPCPTARHHMTIEYNPDAPLEQIRREAFLLCPHSGCTVPDSDRRAMNATGRWVPEAREIDPETGEVTGEPPRTDIASFWIVGAMSPFIIGGIGTLAANRVSAERTLELTGDDKPIRTVMCKEWGYPYSRARQVGQMDAATLAERCDPDLELRTVPRGCRFLTAGADVQPDRFEVLVRGWGAKGESWVVDRWKRLAETSTSTADWDALIDSVVTRAYPLADGSGRTMAVRAFGFDSGGQAGVTLQANDAWKRAKERGQVRRFGKIEGHEAYSVMPLKGASSAAARRITVSFPSAKGADRKVVVGGTVPLLLFAPNGFKDDLATQLAKADPGAWHVHFPEALKDRLPPHRFFEQLVSETRRFDGRWEKPHQGVRNEALDLMVMTHVMAALLGLHRVKWDRPPPWASDWDRNPMVKPAEPVNATPEAGKTVERVEMAPEVRPSVTVATKTAGKSIGARYAALNAGK
jgi:phage terminase large subunit GpA-like protein